MRLDGDVICLNWDFGAYVHYDVLLTRIAGVIDLTFFWLNYDLHDPYMTQGILCGDRAGH